jgi:hypothetical protein
LDVGKRCFGDVVVAEGGGAVGAKVTGEAECGGSCCGGCGEGILGNLARRRDRGRVRRSVPWMVVKLLREVHEGTYLFSASWALWSSSSSFSNLCQTYEFGFWLCDIDFILVASFTLTEGPSFNTEDQGQCCLMLAGAWILDGNSDARVREFVRGRRKREREMKEKKKEERNRKKKN